MTTSPIPPHPTRSASLEVWFDQLGAAWDFNPLAALDSIDQAAGLANQARHEPLNGEVVERYTAAVLAGDQFPPLIIDADTWAALAGNHRYAALTAAGHTTHPCYFVTATTQVLRRIRFEDNARHGLPPSMAERLEHGMALIADGLPQNVAAAAVGIAAPKLSMAAAVLDAEQRAAEAGLTGFSRLPETIRYELSHLDNEEVFTEAARVTLECALPLITVRPLIRAVKAAPSTVEAMRLIGAEEGDHEHRGRQMAGNVRRSSRTARARMEGALIEIRGLNPLEVYETCPNDDVRRHLAESILAATTVMRRAHKLLEQGPPR